jgi:transglutaminase-like putative cysteine protease
LPGFFFGIGLNTRWNGGVGLGFRPEKPRRAATVLLANRTRRGFSILWLAPGLGHNNTELDSRDSRETTGEAPFHHWGKKSTMKRILIRHNTCYSYDSPIRLGPHTLLLRPREGHDLRIASSALDIFPKAMLTYRRDLYENVLGVATFGDESVTELTIENRVEVELYETTPLNFHVEDHALYFPFRYEPEERAGLLPYLESVYGDNRRVGDWLASYRQVSASTETFTVLDRMNRQIHAEIAYEARNEAGVLNPAETLRRGTGSCRDLAALFLESCRRLGIAARFVSGYVHGPSTEIGGAASHAWAEVYLPGAGWKGFDPTNAAIVGPNHITVAVHRNPEAIPPVAGNFTGPEGVSSAPRVNVQISALQDL